MQLIATNVSPVRSASARGHRLRVQAPAAPHLRLTRKQTFSGHFRALRIAPGSGCRLGAIHPTSENRNSAKFTVANGSSTHRQALKNKPCCPPLGSKRSDLVTVVAPTCIKGLRLVTVQLPENSRPSDRAQANFACTEFSEVLL